MTYQGVEQINDNSSSGSSKSIAAATSAREAYNPATTDSSSDTKESTATSLPAVDFTGGHDASHDGGSGSQVHHHRGGGCHDHADGVNGGSQASGLGGTNEGQASSQNLPADVQQLFSSLNTDISQLTTEVSQLTTELSKLQTELNLGASGTNSTGAASAESISPTTGGTSSDSTGTSVSSGASTGDTGSSTSPGNASSSSEGVTSGTVSAGSGTVSDSGSNTTTTGETGDGTSSNASTTGEGVTTGGSNASTTGEGITTGGSNASTTGEGVTSGGSNASTGSPEVTSGASGTSTGSDSGTITSTTNPSTTPTDSTTGTSNASGSSANSGDAGIIGVFGGDTDGQEADSLTAALGKTVVPEASLDETQPAAQTTQYMIGQYASWVAANPGKSVIIDMPLTFDGQSLSSTASGANDSEFTQMAQQLVAAGQGNDIIRLGVEMNGPWATANYDGNPQDFINAYNNAAEAMKAVPGANFSFDWNPGDGEYNNVPVEDYYPGNANVNSIGVDVYDQNYGNTNSTPAETWNVLTTEAGGLNELAAFAQKEGKPFAIPEYAVAAPYGQSGNANAGMYGSGDDPSFINNIANFLNTQAQNEGVAFQSYFDSASGGVGTSLENSPNSYAAYIQDYSNGGIDGEET